MGLKTIAMTSLKKNEWVDITKRGVQQAIVDMTIVNRGYKSTECILAIAPNTRKPLNSPAGLIGTKSSGHIAGSTNYVYSVSAVDKSGETLASEDVTVTECANQLSARDSIKLSWEPVTGAIKYNIYGRMLGNQEIIAETLETQYVDDGTGYLGGTKPTVNTTDLKSRLWVGNIGINTALEVTARKFLIDENSTMTIYVTEDNVDLTAFGSTV